MKKLHDFLQMIHLLPSDSWHRSADCSSCEDHGFSFFDVRRREAFDEFRRHDLLLFDDVQVALEGRFSGFVLGNARDDSRVQSADVRDHQRIASGLVDQNLVGHVVHNRELIDVPRHFGVWSASYATVESVYVEIVYVSSHFKKKLILEDGGYSSDFTFIIYFLNNSKLQNTIPRHFPFSHFAIGASSYEIRRKNFGGLRGLHLHHFNVSRFAVSFEADRLHGHCMVNLVALFDGQVRGTNGATLRIFGQERVVSAVLGLDISNAECRLLIRVTYFDLLRFAHSLPVFEPCQLKIIRWFSLMIVMVNLENKL